MRPFPAAAFALYRLAGLAIRPVAPLILSWRVSKGKEDPNRLGERYGRPSKPRPEGRLVWIHAASVGETFAVLPLIRRMTSRRIGVVLTTVTLTAAKIADERLPAGAVHQFAPIDSRPFTEAFLDHWRPDLAVFVESELWPQAIMSLAGRNIPLAIANARLSEKSFAGWSRHRSVAAAMLSRVSLCLAQSPRDGERYRVLGAPKVIVTGNLKFDSPPLLAAEEAVAATREAIGSRPVWVAASTHPGEEEMVGEAHAILAARYPDLLTIIVPRHPERGPDIAAALAARGLAVARRRAADAISSQVAVYVADTMGELGLFYRLAPVAFIGGSLVKHGGQNPIEPISLGGAVVHGPHVHNFADIYDALGKLSTALRVTDSRSLAAATETLLADPARRERIVAEAREALKPFSGALTATWDALSPYLSASLARGRGSLATAGS
jgi:3-deoxy-D-manno-octulosonic-acid transferase